MVTKARKIPEVKSPEDLEEPPEAGGYENSSEFQESLDKARATLKLINELYETPENRMAELTFIPRRLVMRFACMVCKEAAIDKKRDPITQPISKIFRLAVYQLMRSVGGFHLMQGGRLAETQLRPEEEDEIEIRNG